MGLFKRKGTIIAEGLKIVGSVTAEGLVEVNGHIDGDLHCTSLVISPKASIMGGVEADRVVVNGRVEGPIRGGEVVLKKRAHVIGDIQHQSLAIEFGRLFRRALGALGDVERAGAGRRRRSGRSGSPCACAARLRRTGGSPRRWRPARKSSFAEGGPAGSRRSFFLRACPRDPRICQRLASI